MYSIEEYFQAKRRLNVLRRETAVNNRIVKNFEGQHWDKCKQEYLTWTEDDLPY